MQAIKRIVSVILTVLVVVSCGCIPSLCIDGDNVYGLTSSSIIKTNENVPFTNNIFFEKEVNDTKIAESKETSVPLKFNSSLAVGGNAANSKCDIASLVKTPYTTELIKYLESAIHEISIGNSTDNSTIIDVALTDLGFEPTQFTPDDVGSDDIGDLEDFILNHFGITNDNQLLNTIFEVLLMECPFDLYWFNKTDSLAIYLLQGISEEDGDATYYPGKIDGTFETLTVNNYRFQFILNVAKEFRGPYYTMEDYGGEMHAIYFTVGTDHLSLVNTAKNKANQIVNKYKTSSDLEKLLGYEEEICKLTDYNNEASKLDTTNNSEIYGNPWQPLWVFDGDSSTTVVCEGYSKAFQYLCDITDFDDDSIYCNSFCGNMTAYDSKDRITTNGAHMWNIVSIGGKNYLVDVTNDDNGTSPRLDLFLKAPEKSGTPNGYTFIRKKTDKAKIVYKVDLTLYNCGVLPISYYTLSERSYTPYSDGDANGDGKADINDCVTVALYLNKKLTLDDFKLISADFDHDGSVTLDDAVALAEALVVKI